MNKEDNKVGKEGNEMATVSIPEPPKVSLPPLERIKQMTQEAIKKKGLTEEDIDRILKSSRYGKED